MGVDIWSLPGPRRFVGDVVEACLVEGARIVDVEVPLPILDGMLDRVGRRLREIGPAVHVRQSGALDGRTPVHDLARLAGISAADIPSLSSFVSSRHFRRCVFMVADFDGPEARIWQMFARTMAAEPVPPGHRAPVLLAARLPGRGAQSALRWAGQVGRLDALHIAGETLDARSLLDRTALSVAIETFGWNLDALDEALGTFGTGDLLCQQPVLRAMAAARHPDPPVPDWENGLLGLWDGLPFVDAPALYALGRQVDLNMRVWAGQNAVLFPLLDAVRRACLARWRGEIAARVGPTRPFPRQRPGGGIHEVVDPSRLELAEILRTLDKTLPERAIWLLRAGAAVRRCLAHFEATTYAQVQTLESAWRGCAREFEALAA